MVLVVVVVYLSICLSASLSEAILRDFLEAGLEAMEIAIDAMEIAAKQTLC